MLSLLIMLPSFVNGAQVHRVSRGETLFTIATNYGITLNELINQNGYLRNHNNISAGQVVIIPQKKEANIYVVGEGDSLFKISQNLGVSVTDLAKENSITDVNRLSVGEKLKVPNGVIRPTKSGASTGEYIVKNGDSLFNIAQQFGVTVAALGEANNLGDWNFLYVGQILKIPTAPTQRTQQPEASFKETTASLVSMYPNTFFIKGASNTNKIALTFDDGPNQKYTNEVLDVLKQYNVPATFFVMGARVDHHPEIINRIVREGHVIGNHTWNHPDLRRVSQESLVNEINQTEDSIYKITGLRTALMRPPYGAVTRESIEGLIKEEYKIINWSVDSIDWRDQDVDQILINTLPDVRQGGILLFHDGGGEGQSHAATVASLPEIIQTLKYQGYEFVTVDELLNIPAYK